MKKPREFWLSTVDRCWYAHHDDVIGMIHVREVIPDDEKGDKYLAMCKYVDLKNEELDRVTRALEKAKKVLKVERFEFALKEIKAIESGTK